MMEQPV